MVDPTYDEVVDQLLDEIVIGPVPPTGNEVDYCIRSYFDDLEPLFGAQLTLEDYPLPEGSEPPTGVFLMARRLTDSGEDELVGCGVLSTLEDGVGYVSRMWVHQSARGQGLGRRILDSLEDHAIRFGHRRVRLYTHASLAQAQALYRRSGYREVEPFFEEAPFADVFFEKDFFPE